MDDRRSVLFVDFDNIFGGLMELDREAALAFAREPGRWLDRVGRHGLGGEGQRRFLQCRAYLNPAGWVYDAELGNSSGRLYLQKFRPSLTKAGFEVIDCPALTQRHKNAADIRIVIDVLGSLDGNIPFDEIVIASSDADFTPLLQLLRSRDRRMMVLSAGEVSPAYYSVADSFVGPDTLINLLTDDADVGGGEAEPDTDDDGRSAVERRLLNRLGQSSDPVLLSQIGNELRSRFGAEIESTGWFGAGGLTPFIAAIDGGRLCTDNTHVWDPDQHDAPDDGSGVAGPTAELPPLIEDLRAAAELPPISSPTWAALFDALARYAALGDFNFTACTATVRDELKSSDTPIGRAAVGFVVRGAQIGGVRLDTDPTPTADQIRDAFKHTVIDRYEAATGFTLSPEEVDAFDLWLRDL